jgi:hypothetical protein
MGWRIAFAVLAAALAVAPAAGCGVASSSEDPSAPEPTASAASPASVLPVPSKEFTAPELGVSLLYPATWGVKTEGSLWSGGASVTLTSPGDGAPGGFVLLQARSDDAAAGATPKPFGDATAADLEASILWEKAAGFEPAWTGFRRLGGLRMAALQAASADADPIRLLAFSSGSVGADGSQVSVVSCAVMVPESSWPEQRETLLAVLKTLRFSTPQPEQ